MKTLANILFKKEPEKLLATIINDYAFGGMNTLKSIECGAEVPPSIGEDTFSWMLDKSGVTLTVPASSVEAYSQSAWSGFNIQGKEVEAPYVESVEVDGVIYGDFTKEAPYTCAVIDHLDDLNQQGFTIHSTVAANGNEYSVKVIKEAVFKGYKDVYGEVVIEDGIEEIEAEAFNGFYSRSFVLPSTLKTIGSRAFYGCMALESIEIPGSVEEVSDNAFGYCKKLGNVVIGDGTRVLGSKCFFSCGSLKSIALPSSVETISDSAFEDCDDLSEITLPENLTVIGSNAFYGCGSLSEISLPAGLTVIPSGLFAYSGIKRIDIPASVTVIGTSAFEYCTQLESVEIPSTATTIEMNAFSNCEGMTTLTINDGVETIGDNAFYECLALTDVVVPSSVLNVGRSAFNGCAALERAEIYSENISGYSFVRCTSLKNIVLGEKLKNIEEGAFKESDIESVEVMAAVPPVLDASAFNDNTYENAVLKVTSGTQDAYKEAEGWKRFKIQTTGVESVSNNVKVEILGGKAVFNESADIRVIDMLGEVLIEKRVEDGETIIIPGTGVRILTVGDRSYKIIR